MQTPTLAPGLPPVPDLDAVSERYRAFEKTLASGSAVAAVETVREWDELRRQLETWSSLTNLRFTQDTRDTAARAARARCDEASATLEGSDTTIKRMLTVSAAREVITGEIGAHAFRLWESDLATFDPVIEADRVLESNLRAEYMQLMAGIEVDFAGERLNLSGLQKFQSDPDRAVRYAASKMQWEAMGERAPELDELFNRLVHLRDGMARKLGYKGFVPLGLARVSTGDYGGAVSDANAAIAINARDPNNFEVLGLAFYALGKCGQAKVADETAVRLSPDRADMERDIKVRQRKLSARRSKVRLILLLASVLALGTQASRLSAFRVQERSGRQSAAH